MVVSGDPFTVRQSVIPDGPDLRQITTSHQRKFGVMLR
jgi:hypothetical protein